MPVPPPPLTVDNGDGSVGPAVAAVVVDIDVVAAGATGASAAAAVIGDVKLLTTAPSEWELARASVHSAGNPDSLLGHCRHLHHHSSFPFFLLLHHRHCYCTRLPHLDWSHFRCRVASWLPPNQAARSCATTSSTRVLRKTSSCSDACADVDEARHTRWPHPATTVHVSACCSPTGSKRLPHLDRENPLIDSVRWKRRRGGSATRSRRRVFAKTNTA